MSTTIVSRPSSTVSSGYDSKFCSVHNPIIYRFERKDYTVTEVRRFGTKAQPVVASDITSELTVGDYIFVYSADLGSKSGTITSFTFAGGETLIITDIEFPGLGIDSGSGYYLNLTTDRPDYKVKVDIYDKSDNLIASVPDNYPFADGILYFDVAPFLRDRVNNTFGGSYSAVNAKDENSTIEFYIKYLVSYTGSSNSEIDDSSFNFFACNTTKQVLQEHGSNIGEHVSFNADLAEADKAQFLCPFEKPIYWEGYPFTLNFIFQDTGASPTLSREEENFDTSGASIGTTSTNLVDTDYDYIHSLTLTGGYSAGEEIDVWIQTDGVATNSPPVASSLTLSGSGKQGQTLTAGYTYSDADGDAEGVTTIEWFSYTNSGLTTGETSLGTGTTYLITASEVGKYIAFKVTPEALTGVTPGTTVKSSGIGKVSPNTAAFTYTTGISGTHDLIIGAQYGCIDWGDGSEELFDLGGSETTIQHTYLPGSRTVTVYATPSTITSINLSGETLTGTLDISACTSITSLLCTSNSGLTAISNPTHSLTWSNYRFDSCNLSSLDLSGLTGLGGVVTGSLNSNLTSITFPTSSQTISSFKFGACDITGTLDLSGLTGLGGNIQIHQNSNMTAVIFPTSSVACTFLWVYSCDITGTLNISGMTGLGGQVRLYSNSNMTDITFPASSGNITELRCDACNLNYTDITNLTLSSAITLLTFKNNSMTAAEVNQILVDMDATLPNSGTGTITMDGTNAAPDTTSGGFNGSAAATNLASEGYSVTTS